MKLDDKVFAQESSGRIFVINDRHRHGHGTRSVPVVLIAMFIGGGCGFLGGDRTFCDVLPPIHIPLQRLDRPAAPFIAEVPDAAKQQAAGKEPQLARR